MVIIVIIITIYLEKVGDIMISINSFEIEKELIYLNKLLEEYESNYLMLFKELNSSSFFWKDGKSDLFYKNVPKEFEKNKNYYDEIKSIKDFYNIILEKYHKIGDKIEIEMSSQESIIEKFNKTIELSNDILSSYKHLDLSFCEEEREIINEYKNELKELIIKLKEEKNKIKNLFNKIEDIENQINEKIVSLKITYFKELEFESYI